MYSVCPNRHNREEMRTYENIQVHILAKSIQDTFGSNNPKQIVQNCTGDHLKVKFQYHGLLDQAK